MSKIEASNKDIKFPSHHYVGFQSRPTSDNSPLGFMTPDGTDSAAVKRKASVDSWAAGGHWNKPKEVVPSVTYENKPMVGFKLSREIRRNSSFGSGNVKWRIEDPRGFELEISSPNFAQILMLCTMEKGEIQDQLIWGRLGSENVLVPVESEQYQTAVANTARIAKKASLRDLKLGDTAIMQNGDEGIFMGVFYFCYGSYSHHEVKQEASDKKRYLFKFKGTANHYPYFSVASPKMSEIIPGDGTLTQEAAEQEINAVIQTRRKKNSYDSGIRESGYGRIAAVTSTAPKKSPFKVTKVLEQDFADAAKNGSGAFWGMLGNRLVSFEMKNYHDTCARNRNGFDKVWITEWNQTKLNQTDPEFQVVQAVRIGYYNGNDDRMTPHTNMPDKVWTYKVEVTTDHSGTFEVWGE